MADLFGIADLHIHLTSHLGYGATVDDATLKVTTRGVFWGEPGGAFETSVPDIDIPACDGTAHAPSNNPITNPTRTKILGMLAQEAGGLPHFPDGRPHAR